MLGEALSLSLVHINRTLQKLRASNHITLGRGVVTLHSEKELAEKLARGKPLRVKYGVDPTSPDIHLGHAVGLRKLRQFQELGHRAVLIIGNFTALVGDPSGRDKSRELLTLEKIEENAKDYLTQISKIIDIPKAEVTRNGDWFGKFGFQDVLELTGQMTLHR